MLISFANIRTAFWREIPMKTAVFLVAVLLLPATVGRAEVLGTATLTSGQSFRGAAHRVRPAFGYNIGNAEIEKVLFNDSWIDSSSVGLTLDATPASDSDFSAVAAYLTNGTADLVWLGTCEEISCGFWGSTEDRSFSLATPDFAPATIQRVRLRVNDLSFGLDTRGGEVVYFSFTVSVEGERTTPVRPMSWGQLKAAYRPR
jgi:hypothetical protein